MLSFHFLFLQAAAQIEYHEYAVKVENNLKKKRYRLTMDKSAQGMRKLFDNAEQLCRDNPDMQSSIVIMMLKGVVAKGLHGKNAKTEEAVVNFVRYIHTFDPKAAEVLSANVCGIGKRWLLRLNARERKDCIIDEGKEGEKVVCHMTNAIKQR